MRFVKRLIILSGEGGKGTLGLEKNAYGIFAKLNTYGRPLMSADVVLRIDGSFFSHSLTGSRDSFNLSDMDSMDVIHAAVFSDGELMMYGTNDAQRLDKAAVQAFVRHKQGGGGKSGLFSGRKSAEGGAYGSIPDRANGGASNIGKIDGGRDGAFVQADNRAKNNRSEATAATDIGRFSAQDVAKGAGTAEQVVYRDDQIAEENFYPEGLGLGRRTGRDFSPQTTQAEVAAALTLQRSLQDGDGQNGDGHGRADAPKTGLEKLMRSTPYKIKMHRPLSHGSAHSKAADGYTKDNAENEVLPAAMEHMFVMSKASLIKSSPSAFSESENGEGASRRLHKDNQQKAVQTSANTVQNTQQNPQQNPLQKSQYNQQQRQQGGKLQAHGWQGAKSREEFFEEQRQEQNGGRLADFSGSRASRSEEYDSGSRASRPEEYDSGSRANRSEEYDSDHGANYAADFGAGADKDIGAGFGEDITGVFGRTSYIGMISPDDGTGAAISQSLADAPIQRGKGARDDKRSLRAESRHPADGQSGNARGQGNGSGTRGQGNARGGNTQGERAPHLKPDPHIKARQSTFFEQNGEEIEKLFNGPREKQLEQLLPNSKWVKIDYDDTGKYYVIGIIGKDYLCYGVPASFTPDPPEELMGYCWWLPLDNQQPEGKGYWIMYQNLSTGEAVFPI